MWLQACLEIIKINSSSTSNFHSRHKRRCRTITRRHFHPKSHFLYLQHNLPFLFYFISSMTSNKEDKEPLQMANTIKLLFNYLLIKCVTKIAFLFSLLIMLSITMMLLIALARQQTKFKSYFGNFHLLILPIIIF